MHWMTTLMYVLTFIIGLVTASIALGIQGDVSISNVRCSTALQKANTGVLVLSIIMITATVVLAYCSYNCSRGSPSLLNSEDKISAQLMIMYYGFMLIICIILTTLGAIIKNGAKHKDRSCPTVEGKGNAIMAIGIIGIVIMIGPFAVKIAYHGGKSLVKDIKTGKYSSA